MNTDRASAALSASRSADPVIAAGVLGTIGKAIFWIFAVVFIIGGLVGLLIGFFVDRTRTRWGTFRPYILATAVPVALLTWGLFSILAGAERTQLVVIAIAYLAWDIAYTACDVPLWSLTAVITTDEQSRARLVAGARTAAMIGLAVITLGGAPLAIALSGGDEPTA